MKKFSIGLTLTAMLAGMLPATTVEAHGIWFAQRAKQIGLIYGVGADDLDTVKRLPLFKNVAGYDAQWQPIVTTLRVAGPLVLVDSESQPTAVAAVLENGIWSKTPDGEWHKKGRDELPHALLSEKTVKFAVSIQGPLLTAIPPLPDQTLQIVTVTPGLPDLLGKPLKLRVLFQGKPVAGAMVLSDYLNDPDAKPRRTAADGSITIKVRNQGLNVISAVFKGPPDDPKKIDLIEYLATLAFTLPHAPE